MSTLVPRPQYPHGVAVLLDVAADGESELGRRVEAVAPRQREDGPRRRVGVYLLALLLLMLLLTLLLMLLLMLIHHGGEF